MAKTGIYLEI